MRKIETDWFEFAGMCFGIVVPTFGGYYLNNKLGGGTVGKVCSGFGGIFIGGGTFWYASKKIAEKLVGIVFCNLTVVKSSHQRIDMGDLFNKTVSSARREACLPCNGGYVSLADMMQYGATSGLPKDRYVSPEQELDDVLGDASSSDEDVRVDVVALLQEKWEREA